MFLCESDIQIVFLLFGVIMSTKPEYTGMDKYPGIIATVLTLGITAIFLGALAMSAGDHGDDHGAEHGAEHAEEAH